MTFVIEHNYLIIDNASQDHSKNTWREGGICSSYKNKITKK